MTPAELADKRGKRKNDGLYSHDADCGYREGLIEVLTAMREAVDLYDNWDDPEKAMQKLADYLEALDETN